MQWGFGHSFCSSGYGAGTIAFLLVFGNLKELSHTNLELLLLKR